ncbi:hypothetical protein KI387_002029, partial [Taxus chinensis]
MAEAMALQNGIQSVVLEGWKEPIMEGDSQVIINALRGNNIQTWKIRGAIDEIKWLHTNFNK